MKLWLLFFVVYSAFAGVLQAQDDAKRLAILNIDLSEFDNDRSAFSQIMLSSLDVFKQNALSSIPEHLIQAYAGDPNFVVLDRINYHLITEERERQKSEEFINGYTIAQGQSEGIDFLVTSKYLPVNNSISVRVFEIATGLVKCEVNVEVVRSKVDDQYTSYYVSLILDQLNECLDVRFPVVRMTDTKGGKAKTLLIAAGSNHQMSEKKRLELFEVTEIEVEGKILHRPVVLGTCEISEVEGGDFSIAKVTSGHAQIHQKLEQKVPVYCRVKHIKI